MFLPRYKGPLLALIVVSALALQVTPALAYVNDITTGLLPASAAPAGFSAPKDQVYLRFHSDMSVKTHPGRTASPACISDKSFSREGWKQGMIEAFPSQQVKSVRTLTLCAWRFKTVGGAQKAYGFEVNPLKTDLKPKSTPKKVSKGKTKKKAAGKVVSRTKNTLKLLSKARIGDESLAVEGGTGLITYALYFRNANALVEIKYTGPSSFSPPSFLSLGRTVNSKLR